MRDEFDRARSEWESAVRNAAADLIRQGVPPLDAIERAREVISESRKPQPLRSLADFK